MRGGSTPAWTVIVVPPTPNAPAKHMGVRIRTVRIVAMLALLVLLPAIALSWSWVDTQTSHAVQLTDRVAAQERMLAMLTDSLQAYRRAAITADSAARGGNAMLMPLSGRISSWFSRSRLHPILRVWRPHRGVDFSAPSGTRIVAPATATVVSVRRQFGFGLTVELLHGDGVVTRYAHCRSTLVKAGDRVAAGQAIATVGSTGLATAPHLHFEVLVRGKAVDPMRFLARRQPPTIPARAVQAASPRESDDE